MATTTKAEESPAVEPVTAAAPDETDDSPIALRYTGDGHRFFHGVPRRDLTKAEADDIKAQRPVIYAVMTTPADGQDTPLYERIKGGK